VISPRDDEDLSVTFLTTEPLGALPVVTATVGSTAFEAEHRSGL
jgi:hypothetical protein